MKRIVITPTFRPHFPFNREFLESWRDRVRDAGEVAVHFVVSREELPDMSAMLAAFPELDVHAHALEDLLREAGHEVESLDLLREVGKFAFQALKKLYALKVLEYDQALILDSESLVLKPARMGEAFDEYFADPFVFYSDLEHRGERWLGSLSDVVTQNAARLLRIPYPRMYLLEYYGWFYEKRLVNGMFTAVGEDLLGAVRRLGREKHVFECVLYYSYLYSDPARHGYRFESVNDLLREYLGPQGYAEYIGNFGGIWEPLGIFEYVSKEVNERNLPGLLRLFRDRGLRFYRSEVMNRNERSQDTLIAESPITFLVSSEQYRRIRERVAVCISGLPRNYRQNLPLLRNFLAESGADVFFHFWDTPDQDYIVRALEPKGHEFERNELSLDFLPAAHRERFAPGHRDGNTVSMFYGIWKANELKRAYEEKHGFRYDAVVRLRMDFFSVAGLNDILQWIRGEQRGWERTLYVPDAAHSVGINDQVALGSSDTMDVYAGVYPQLPRMAAEEYFNPEYLLLRHVLRGGLRILTFPFEYVLLRDEPLDTFDLEVYAQRTQNTWWSARLPLIPADGLGDYFRAKADSVYQVARMEVETPKVFRLAAPGGRWLRVDEASRALEFASSPERASLFYLIIAGDEDRTAVNLRCRNLALENRAGGQGWNLYPDARGQIQPDGAADPFSAFFVAGAEGGLTFEWRPGFWMEAAAQRVAETRTPGGRRVSGNERRGVVRRRFLTAGPGGLALGEPGAAGEVFTVEYVPDAEAEASDIGIHSQLTLNPVANSDPLLIRLLWRSYLSARIVQDHGFSEFVGLATRFIRQRTFPVGAGAEGGGLLSRTLRFVRRG